MRSLVWAIALVAGACLLYFVVIPVGIENPSYATQSPRLFPSAVAVMIGLLALILIVGVFAGFGGAAPEPISRWFFVMPTCAALYALSFDAAGFLLTTALALAGLLLLLGERRWRMVVAAALLVAVGIYVSFVHLLGIPLPAGILG